SPPAWTRPEYCPIHDRPPTFDSGLLERTRIYRLLLFARKYAMPKLSVPLSYVWMSQRTTASFNLSMIAFGVILGTHSNRLSRTTPPASEPHRSPCLWRDRAVRHRHGLE